MVVFRFEKKVIMPAPVVRIREVLSVDLVDRFYNCLLSEQLLVQFKKYF